MSRDRGPGERKGVTNVHADVFEVVTKSPELRATHSNHRQLLGRERKLRPERPIRCSSALRRSRLVANCQRGPLSGIMLHRNVLQTGRESKTSAARQLYLALCRPATQRTLTTADCAPHLKSFDMARGSGEVEHLGARNVDGHRSARAHGARREDGGKQGVVFVGLEVGCEREERVVDDSHAPEPRLTRRVLGNACRERRVERWTGRGKEC